MVDMGIGMLLCEVQRTVKTDKFATIELPHFLKFNVWHVTYTLQANHPIYNQLRISENVELI